MNETDLRTELERAARRVDANFDGRVIWEGGRAARRRTRVVAALGAATAVGVIAVGTVQLASPALTPAPEPMPGTPTTEAGEWVEIPAVRDDQVAPVFDPARLGEVPWDDATSLRSWDPVDPVPLAEDPVEHAALAVQSLPHEEPAISVLGDEGRWRSLDLAGIEVNRTNEATYGVTYRSLSPDGTRLALGQRDSVIVVDLTTGDRRTYPVTGLGQLWTGRDVSWSADGETVYVAAGYTYSRTPLAVDLASGATRPVPFDPTSAAFLDGGRVVEDRFRQPYGHSIRVYDGTDRLLVKSRGTNLVLGALGFEFGRGDRWAALREQTTWDTLDPDDPAGLRSGVLVLDDHGRPLQLLPVAGYENHGGGGGVVGWRGDDTVLFRIFRNDGPDGVSVLAWDTTTEEITRIADYTHTPGLSVAGDYLPD